MKGMLIILDIMTIITTLALCKASSRADKMVENINKFNINIK
jgi:hypothetical protein